MFQRTVSFWRRLIHLAPVLSDPASVAEDRRRTVRYRIDQPVCYRPAAAEVTLPSQTAQLRDVSVGGISLEMEQEFRPGDLLSVQLPGQGEEKPTSVLACVVHVGRRPENRWTVGCTFASDLSPNELNTFEAKGGRQTDADQRNQPRHPCLIEASFQLVGESSEDSWPARVMNISTTGVGLSVGQAISVGKLLNVELHATGRADGRNVLCCAVHVTEQGTGEWLVGCNFITELEENAFEALLRC